MGKRYNKRDITSTLDKYMIDHLGDVSIQELSEASHMSISTLYKYAQRGDEYTKFPISLLKGIRSIRTDLDYNTIIYQLEQATKAMEGVKHD